MLKVLRDKLKRNDVIVAIIGLGYIGLPLARGFSKMLKVIGYDIDTKKSINYLKAMMISISLPIQKTSAELIL